jgi:lipopolysaccharide cholinephosphotransferase
MRELSLQESKAVGLKVLLEIDKICRENDITYSLSYGTLLGAVRHGGFIPWDDDIDIMMPRKDYLNFIEYCKNNETPFSLASFSTDDDYGYMFAKACDKSTTLILENMKWSKDGVWVDIFPVENLGNDKQTAKKRFRKKRFARELLVAWNWKHYKKNKYKSLMYNVAKFIFFLMSRFASNKRLLKSINKYYNQFYDESTKYTGIVCGTYRSREIMESSVYDEYTDIVFEGEKFRTISKYHEYLSIVYGDYMQLPPQEKRVCPHDFKTYYKD